ncbi:MAG: hypothetical protein AAF728_06370, partial [Cyanobacteria bacterium P01_D01_bin.128]
KFPPCWKRLTPTYRLMWWVKCLTRGCHHLAVKSLCGKCFSPYFATRGGRDNAYTGSILVLIDDAP